MRESPRIPSIRARTSVVTGSDTRLFVRLWSWEEISVTERDDDFQERGEAFLLTQSSRDEYRASPGFLVCSCTLGVIARPPSASAARSEPRPMNRILEA